MNIWVLKDVYTVVFLPYFTILFLPYLTAATSQTRSGQSGLKILFRTFPVSLIHTVGKKSLSTNWSKSLIVVRKSLFKLINNSSS